MLIDGASSWESAISNSARFSDAMRPQPVASVNDARGSDSARVGQGDWLREKGLFVAEGRFVVRRLFAAGTFAIRSVLVTPVALTALQDFLDPVSCPIYLCEQDVMSQLAGFNFHR